MTEALSDLQVAAALAEMIYRRAKQDQPIDLLNIADDVHDFPIVKPPSLNLVDNSFFYDDATGFVGRVVDANGKIFVVLRGTDFENWREELGSEWNSSASRICWLAEVRDGPARPVFSA